MPPFAYMLVHHFPRELKVYTVNVTQLFKDKRSYDYKSVRRWTTQKKIGYSLIDCDKVIPMLEIYCSSCLTSPDLITEVELVSFVSLGFMPDWYEDGYSSLTRLCFLVQILVPIHQDIHWCLAVINIRDQRFEYLDSLNGRDENVLRVLVST